jgi:hypothetical protein
MQPEDVGHVLRRFHAALVPRGLMLDPQVIRPHPVVEIDEKAVCEIDGGPLFATADPAAAAIDAMAESGVVAEEAVDDHDVLKHYSSGAELVDDFEDSARDLPAEWVQPLRATERACVVRERCRTRRLRSRICGTNDGLVTKAQDERL